MRVIIASIAAMVLSAFSTSSLAMMIVTDVNNPYIFLSENGKQSHTVIHDLTDDGVPTDYMVTHAVLKLAFSDGYRRYDHAFDWADITADGVSRILEVDGTHRWGFDIRWLWVHDDGIDTLNKHGTLAVTVTAMDTKRDENDFWWKWSKLYAKVKPTTVPEPGTLALLGLGLLGIAVGHRYRKV